MSALIVLDDFPLINGIFLAERFGSQTKQKIMDGIELCSALYDEINEQIAHVELNVKLPAPIICNTLSQGEPNISQETTLSTPEEKSTLVNV